MVSLLYLKHPQKKPRLRTASLGGSIPFAEEEEEEEEGVTRVPELFRLRIFGGGIGERRRKDQRLSLGKYPLHCIAENNYCTLIIT